MTFFKRSASAALFSLLAVSFAPSLHADIEKAAAKLRPKSFCVNAGFETAWQETANVLRRMELEPALADKAYGVVVTAFVTADYSKLFKLTSNPRPFLKGRFSLKITLEQVTGSFTKLHIILQVRQSKLFGKKERLLHTRGTFERYLAYLINQEAVAAQFPKLGEIRLGMSLIPDLKTGRYRISNVERDSPAGEAGFKDGDRIETIRGRTITVRGELFEELIFDQKEKQLEFGIIRNSGEHKISVWVVRLKGQQDRIGLKLTKEDDEEFLVKDVQPGSRADHAGIKPGDKLLKAEGLPMQSWANYFRALAQGSGRDFMEVSLERDGREINLKIPAQSS